MMLKELLKSSAFMMSMALVIALLTNIVGVFPSYILDTDFKSSITVCLLAVMMTLSLSRYSFSNLNPVTHWRSILRAIAMGLILSSIIPLAGYFLLRNTEFSGEAAGLVFIAATPFAASVAPLSYILRGDMEHAARGTIYVYIVSLVWIPFIVWAFLGEVVDIMQMVIAVVEVIGMPLVVSRLLTRFELSRDFMAVFMNCCIFVLVWLSVGSTNFSGTIALILVVFGVIAALRSFGLGNLIEYGERRADILWGQRVADILMVSYKNKGIAIAMCAATLGPLASEAMVAITTSIVVEICWVIFMDFVLFNRKRMERELAREASAMWSQ